MTYKKFNILIIIKNILLFILFLINSYNLYSYNNINYTTTEFKLNKNNFLNDSQNLMALKKINKYEKENNLLITTFKGYLNQEQIQLLINNKNLFNLNDKKELELYYVLWQEEGKFTYLLNQNYYKKNQLTILIEKIKNIFKQKL